MGKGCDPKNLAALLLADAQAMGRDIFTEAERINGMDGESLAHYELHMSRHFGIEHRKTGKSGWDILGKKGLSEKPSMLDDRLYNHPSAQFSERFYTPIDKRLTAWSKGKDTSRASYDKTIGKPVGELLDAINTVVNDSKTIAQMNTQLKKFGLNAETVYDARDYLGWLKEGGHLRSQGEAQPLIKGASTIAKAQANLNTVWTLGNGVDMIRVASHYLSRPGGIQNTIKGLYNAAAATKMNPFQRVAALDKQGVYGSHYMDRGGSNSLNPFEWSVTAQKNLVYHMDKAAGGDGLRGIRDTLFDSKPWDRPRYDRYEGAALFNGLARYGINETRWLYKTSKAALTGDLRSGANLGIYFIGRAAFTGTTSLIPSFLWQSMPDEMKESIKEFEKSTGQNLVKIGSAAAFQALGMEAEIDLSEYLQPQVPGFGSRGSTFRSTGQNLLKSGTKAVASIAQGNLPAAGVNAAATALALANFGLLSGIAGKLGKAEKLAGKLENSVINSTTVTKLMNTTAEELEAEFNLDQYKINVVRAAFGSSVKKTKDDNGLPSLPSLPTLPKLNAR